jgi:hypothetical protein
MDELTDPQSCLNKALPDELIFVLLGRDEAAPHAIRCWVQERLRLGKNGPADSQVETALRLANEIEGKQRARRAAAK